MHVRTGQGVKFNKVFFCTRLYIYIYIYIYIYVVGVIVHVTCVCTTRKFLHNYIDALNVTSVHPRAPPSCV